MFNNLGSFLIKDGSGNQQHSHSSINWKEAINVKYQIELK